MSEPEPSSDDRANLSQAEIADSLAFARERREHMKLAELAAELGEDPGNLSRVLNAKRAPYPQFLRAVQRLQAGGSTTSAFQPRSHVLT